LTKNQSAKRPASRTDKLSKVGKKSGVELNETQLDNATGGLIGLLKSSDLKL